MSTADPSTPWPRPNFPRLRVLQKSAEREGRQSVVDAALYDEHGRIFVMRRSCTRAWFPGCWDLPGGKVERGERLEEALAREVREETGWHLLSVDALITITDWALEDATGMQRVRQFDFLARTTRRSTTPTIDAAHFTDYRWLAPNALSMLTEGRQLGDDVIINVIRRAFGMLRARALGSP